MSAFTALKLHADTPADSLSASEYESGFRAGEREQHTERRAGEFFGGGRYALLARARAFFYRGVFYTPSVNVTRSQQRSQQLRNDIVFTRLPAPHICGDPPVPAKGLRANGRSDDDETQYGQTALQPARPTVPGESRASNPV